MAESIHNVLVSLYNHICNLISGIFFAALGYFSEIRYAVYVMLVAILFDLLAGIAASVFIRNEKFSMTKFFVAVFRAIGVLVLVLLLYSMDKEMHQQIAATYNIAAWLICGFYTWSFAENMDVLTGGKIFKILKRVAEKRVKDETGIDISEKTT